MQLKLSRKWVCTKLMYFSNDAIQPNNNVIGCQKDIWAYVLLSLNDLLVRNSVFQDFLKNKVWSVGHITKRIWIVLIGKVSLKFLGIKSIREETKFRSNWKMTRFWNTSSYRFICNLWHCADSIRYSILKLYVTSNFFW